MNEPTGGRGQKSLAVYAVIDRKEKGFWLRVGSAFANRDGSLTLFLDAVPIGTNRLQIREDRPWEDARPSGSVPPPATPRLAVAVAEARP